MDIWEIDKLLLFIAFVIPGFISIKAYQLAFPSKSRAASEQIVDAIAYSCINYALLSWLIFAVEDSRMKEAHPGLYYSFYVFVLFVAPVIWVWIWVRLRKMDVFQKNAPHPVSKPWDYVFSQRKSYWILVYLKNGEKVGGRYSEKSFVSSYPAEEQIYLEETFIVRDDLLDRPVKHSAGIIIMGSEISRIELFNYYQ